MFGTSRAHRFESLPPYPEKLKRQEFRMRFIQDAVKFGHPMPEILKAMKQAEEAVFDAD